jgi:hypothetical protein
MDGPAIPERSNSFPFKLSLSRNELSLELLPRSTPLDDPDEPTQAQHEAKSQQRLVAVETRLEAMSFLSRLTGNWSRKKSGDVLLLEVLPCPFKN